MYHADTQGTVHYTQAEIRPILGATAKVLKKERKKKNGKKKACIMLISNPETHGCWS